MSYIDNVFSRIAEEDHYFMDYCELVIKFIKFIIMFCRKYMLENSIYKVCYNCDHIHSLSC